MTSAAKAKGDRFEVEILDYLRAELGAHLTRPRAGGKDDRGDIAGIPAWCLQLKCFTDMQRGIREGLAGLAVQQANACTPYGAVIVKRRGIAAPERQLFVMDLSAGVRVMRETFVEVQ